MTNYPSTITMDEEVKEVLTYDMKGYFKWVVADGIVLVDPNYLRELFSYIPPGVVGCV